MRKRAKFNLSNFHNCTFKMGKLYPTNLFEVLPGDTIQMSNSVFMRLAPMVAPVMHPTYMFMHHFFVPSRILWDGFEDFITGGDDGSNTATVPQALLTYNNSVSRDGTPFASLIDALGIPTQMLKSDGSNSFTVNILPLLAYYFIWNEYYRDQDLQAEIDWKAMLESALKSPYNNPNSWNMWPPCWSKDYFTTARPWPQKGPEVTVPVQAAGGGITGNVNIIADGPLMVNYDGSEPSFDTLNSAYVKFSNNSGQNIKNRPAGLYVDFQGMNDSVNAGQSNALQYSSGLSAAFESTTPGGIGSININDLREAFSIQRFEEHRSMFGSRYEDLLRYLGVKPQDSRLQLPEYLGGFSAPVQFSEVLQTSADETGGVGDLYGHGIAAARGRRVRRFIPEHGYIMSLLCVRPIPVYSQGIERLWSKSTKYDFWTKELEHIGQQEVLNSEVYADGTSDDGNTFGFQNRYDEYRRGVNVISGEFRTNQDFWTLSRIFANRPALNGSFVECNPSDRIFQVGEQNSDQIYCMVKNNVIARRLVSKNGNPI